MSTALRLRHQSAPRQAPPAANQPDEPDDTEGSERAERELAAERWRVRFIGLALAMLCLGLFVGKTAWDGTAALARGDEAARRGALDAAISDWTLAARAYLPGAAYAGMAHRRLLELGDDASEHGEVTRADRAYAAVCEAIADTAWAITPYAEELARAEAGRASLRQAALSGDRTAWSRAKRTGKRSRARAAASAAVASSLAPASPMTPRLAAAMHARTWAGVGFLGLTGVVLAIALLRSGPARSGSGRVGSSGRRARDLRTRWAAIILAGSAALFFLSVHQL